MRRHAEYSHARTERLALSTSPRQALVLPLMTVAALVLLMMVYVILMNAMTKKTFDLKHLEGLVTDLKHDNKRLEVMIAEQESIGMLGERVERLHMVPAKNTEYLNVSGPVAKR